VSLISIILPYYKKKNFLRESINSILNQTYQNFEILLIDDEVSEDSLNFLEEIKKCDSRIHLIKNEYNIGAGESRNRAIKFSKGQYIAFCDCDDLWKNNKLELQLKFMKKFNLNFSHTSYEIIDENNKILGHRLIDEDINFNKLINSCDIGLSTVMVNQAVFNDAEHRFAKIKTKEDYVLWLILAKQGFKIIGINENLTSWRKTKNSLSSSVFQKLLDGYKVYRIYMKYSRLKSLFCLIRLSINYILKD
jgi:teichuronic acid biosynthesis glycosyltransferase TuaG